MAADTTPPEPRRRLRRGWWMPYLLVGPFLLAFFLFTVVPLGLAGYNSLFVDRLIGGQQFVGLANYVSVLTDRSFWEGAGRMVLYGGIFIPITIGLALLLALALDAAVVRFARVFRTLFFLPYAVPAVIGTLMWGFLYGPTLSPLTDIAERLGIDHLNLLDTSWILPSLGNIGIWSYAGYNMIILYAALRTVPPELSEAAVLDGASRWRIAWHIKVPLITPVLTMIVIFSLIGTMQLFTEPQVLRTLAPRVIGSDFTPNLYAYTLISTGQQLNYVSALCFVLGATVVALSVVYLRLSRKLRST